jgi:hypothetical protein
MVRVSLSLTAQRVVRDVDVVARAGLDLQTFLDEALSSISRAVPHVGACVGTVDPTTLLLTGTVKFGDLHGQDQHDHQWGLLEFGHTEPTAFIELAHRAIPAAAVRAQTPDSLRLNEFMRPFYGYTDELRVVLRDRGQVWGAVAMFRSTAPDFDSADVDVMAQLSESLAVGLRSGLLSRYADLTVTAPVGPTVVIVGADDVVRQMSAGAEERLDDLVTTALGAEPTGIVAGLVGAARRYARGEVTRPPRCRVRSRSGAWLVLHATPLASADGSSGDVVVTIDEARPPEIVPLVVAAFDLTQRERDVTEKVLQGLDTK